MAPPCSGKKAPVPAEGKLKSPDLRRMKVKTPPQVTLKTRCKTERALAGGNGANTFLSARIGTAV